MSDNSLSEYYKSIQETCHAIAQSFDKSYNAMQLVCNIFAQGIEESNKKRPPFLRTMAENGWYLSAELSIPAIEEIANALTTKKSDIEIQLCDYYEKRIDNLDEYIKLNFSYRHGLISDAFWAHKEKKYGLSIPVFLAQCEGMCSDTFKERLYAKKCGKNGDVQMRMADKFPDEVPGTLHYSTILQMIELFPIAENDKSVNLEHLNRHRVMHGIDCSYGTRTNSCKAISLVDYVSWVCNSTNKREALIKDSLSCST